MNGDKYCGTFVATLRCRSLMDALRTPDGNLRARIESEYLEMPGLCLTAAQAARLWALDPERCEQVLGELVDAGFLCSCNDGQYRRDTGGDVCHWHRRRSDSRRAHADHGVPRPVTREQSPSSRFADACEAFAAIIGAAARADGLVLPVETERLEQTLSALPVFRGKSVESRRAIMERATEFTAQDDRSLIQEAARALPAELRDTAFAAGVDVLFSDGSLRESELKFAEELRQLLHVRRSFARKVVGVLGTKNLVSADGLGS